MTFTRLTCGHGIECSNQCATAEQTPVSVRWNLKELAKSIALWLLVINNKKQMTLLYCCRQSLLHFKHHTLYCLYILLGHPMCSSLPYIVLHFLSQRDYFHNRNGKFAMGLKDY